MDRNYFSLLKLLSLISALFIGSPEPLVAQSALNPITLDGRSGGLPVPLPGSPGVTPALLNSLGLDGQKPSNGQPSNPPKYNYAGAFAA